ncbi:TnsA endonuclease N-terminal domain-containing protein [Psychrobacillus psychrodurans]|uniref:TnsA endonuclease N-terminal domain-containing protein n=1 Tax=Psychrobacillus psychrodurans TaxID=126157 RepID=UPI001F4DFB1D|nr:TnsA endonuclease N-terminal domain-containing protein [Psychrobacillus psychrodurans]MCK1997441.1 TnsA endonuclease N-terminal domain-containing protein [Psychrobacillus psychrodurans]
MSKRKRSTSTEKKMKDGRGQGSGTDYKPWIVIQDLGSLGRSTRLKGYKIPRQFEFLSDLERNYFYLLEHSDGVVDIREQYPLLPLGETLNIADELGLKHPTNPKTNEPIEITTDFLITTLNDGQHAHVARTLKYKNDLMNERILEKFEIERVYWERQSVDWGIVTELEVPKTMAHNIAFVHRYADLSMLEGFEECSTYDIEDMSIYFLQVLLAEEKTVKQIAKELEKNFGMVVGCGLSIFKYLVMTKVIEIDLSEKLDVTKILSVKAVRTDFSEKVKAI